jgi:hypothetical protein
MSENLRGASTAATVISLRIERGEPISGTLTLRGRVGEERFCGWMELIAAITAGCRSSVEFDERSPDRPGA